MGGESWDWVLIHALNSRAVLRTLEPCGLTRMGSSGGSRTPPLCWVSHWLRSFPTPKSRSLILLGGATDREASSQARLWTTARLDWTPEAKMQLAGDSPEAGGDLHTPTAARGPSLWPVTLVLLHDAAVLRMDTWKWLAGDKH